MGVCCSQAPPKIVIVGPNGSGKRFLLHAWLFGVEKSTSLKSTKTFIVETITSRATGQRYTLHVISGTPTVLVRNRAVYEGTSAVILMINGAAGVDSINEARRCLDLILVSFTEINFPILIILNRTDAPGAISCDNIRERFGLDIRLVNMRWNICNLRENSQEDVDKLLEELSLLMLKQRKRSHSLNSTEKNSFNSTEN